MLAEYLKGLAIMDGFGFLLTPSAFSESFLTNLQAFYYHKQQ